MFSIEDRTTTGWNQSGQVERGGLGTATDQTRPDQDHDQTNLTLLVVTDITLFRGELYLARESEEVLVMLPRMMGSVPLTLSLLIILFLSIILSTVNIINLSNLQEQYLQVFQNNNFHSRPGKTVKTAKYVVYSKKPDGAFLQHVFNGFRR